MGYDSLSQYVRKQPAAVEAAGAFSTDLKGVVSQPDRPLVSGKPVRIVIKRLKIDLQIVDGYYNTTDQSWTLTSDKAQFATNTPISNNKSGNTFIYGHNNNAVFSKLIELRSGDTVKVYTDNNFVFTYTYRSSVETSPTDDSLFKYEGPAILTLQTCSGLWYQNRQLFTFDFVRVS